VNIGDVIHTKSLTVVFENEKTRGTAGFKAPKGKRFVLLVLGVDSADSPVDAKAALDFLGYIPDPSIKEANPC
jgi:hypothetical protein